MNLKREFFRKLCTAQKLVFSVAYSIGHVTEEARKKGLDYRFRVIVVIASKDLYFKTFQVLLDLISNLLGPLECFVVKTQLLAHSDSSSFICDLAVFVEDVKERYVVTFDDSLLLFGFRYLERVYAVSHVQLVAHRHY